MRYRYLIGTLLIGIGLGIFIGVIMQAYWFFLVCMFIVCGCVLLS